VPIRIRVGLNSGQVVVRAIAGDLHMDYTAVGQTTHLAARMEQLAAPDTIALTDATLALAEGFVEVKSLGPTPVKGLADAVEVYELTGAGAARTRLQASVRRGLTRFVGRDAQLEELRRAQQLAGTGHGQVAAIVGEAGWANRASSTSLAIPIASRAGWSSRAPRSPTARRPATFR
jgi:hypothetical protein